MGYLQGIKIKAHTDLQKYHRNYTNGKAIEVTRKSHKRVSLRLPFMGFKRRSLATKRESSVLIDRLGHIIIFLMCVSLPIVHLILIICMSSYAQAGLG